MTSHTITYKRNGSHSTVKEMYRQHKQEANYLKSQMRRVDLSNSFFFNVLLPDFLMFVIGISAGIGLMLYLFQL